MKLAVVALLVLLVGAASASAHRAPTAKERAALEFAVRFFPPVGRENKLTFRKELVSTVDSRYARVDVYVRDPKGRPVGTPTALLRRGSNGWRVIAFGTDPPRCKVAPVAVRRDLLGTTICLRG